MLISITEDMLMHWLKQISLRLRSLFRRSAVDQELEDELRFHLEHQIDANLRAGMTADEARTSALRAMAGLEVQKEACRDTRKIAFFDNLYRDIRYAARSLRNNPWFSAVAIGTLALGIATNTTIFALVQGVLLQQLPFKSADRLVAIREGSPAIDTNGGEVAVNANHFLRWRQRLHSFESLALLQGLSKNFVSGNQVDRLVGARVSASLFPMLALDAHLGRVFRADEDQPNQSHVVLLSYRLWQRAFHGSKQVLGKAVKLDNEVYEIVGVLSPNAPQAVVGGFSWSREKTDFWIPFSLRESDLPDFGDFNYDCVGRLKPEVSLAQATAELNTLQAQIAATIPEHIQLRAKLIPLRDEITSNYRAGLFLLFAAVGMILIIACVNIANLLLARGAARTREFSIRVAVGASRTRLLQQSLVECALLSLVSGVVGLVLAHISLGFLLAHAPADLPRIDEVRTGASTALFTFAVSCATSLLFGLMPALHFSNIDPQANLKESGSTSTGGKRSRHLQSTLVCIEIALSTACLIVAGLLLKSYGELISVKKGFVSQHIVTFDLHLPETPYADRLQRVAFWRELLAGVETIPGVAATGLSNRLPLNGEGSDNWMLPEGNVLPMSERPSADMRFVNAGFFSALGIPVLSGRSFNSEDFHASRRANYRGIALVSQTTAYRLFPGRQALGRRFRLGGEDTPLLTVIGVVGDVRGNGLEKTPRWTVYLPYWQRDRLEMSLVVRTTGQDAGTLVGAVRKQIRKLDKALPIAKVRTMDEVVNASISQRRFHLSLLIAFGILASLLATLGVYGVVSYVVSQRTKELGLRVILGAAPLTIEWLVLRQGLMPVCQGLLAGLAISFFAAGLLKASLFQVSSLDPAVIASAIGLVMLASLFACWLPARRAQRLDPLKVLRVD